MVELYLKGQKKKYKDWVMYNNNGTLMLKVIFSSNKCYIRPYSEWKVIPTVRMNENLLIHNNNVQVIKEAIKVGGKYYLVKYPSSDITYIMKTADTQLTRKTKLQEKDVFHYFKMVATERLSYAKTEEDKKIAENIIKQFSKILPCSETVLNAYIEGNAFKREGLSHFIYPFGINETQKEAVEKAFTSQVSIIEGPPGTGKTQTILNIIANIIVNGNTCAIVSNNNTAVENVYEKMHKKQLDFLIAKLGNAILKENFFENIIYVKPTIEFAEVRMEEIDHLTYEIKRYLKDNNHLAQIQNEIREIEIEKVYLEQWFSDNMDCDAKTINNYRLSSTKAVKLLAYLRNLPDRVLSFKEKFELFSYYRIFRSNFLNDIKMRQNFIYSLQLTYYNHLLDEYHHEKKQLEKSLKSSDLHLNLMKLKKKSMDYLYQYIHQKMPDTLVDFNKKNYISKFSEFMKYFPVIGSSTHSLINSIAHGYLLDYVIIDEASQQDLIPGILCLSCARNVIVVGDRKQLQHIMVGTKLQSPIKAYDCSTHSLLDSVCELYGDEIPRTLLKEHYRCQPEIIQFCNKQYYNNELIPMTKKTNANPLELIFTSKGNHMRNYANLREIESVLKVRETCGFLAEDTGFIAPYNAQINLAKTKMLDDIVKDTIHKFQGRECDHIIFSTVLDKKKVSQRQIDFVDEASLVNVAVSRAKSKFTLVTGNNVFIENNKHIAALIRYMEYYADNESIHDSPVVSAFDLLYTEYDACLEQLNRSLNLNDSRFKSEQIVSSLLKQVLQEKHYKNMVVHKQIFLRQLVSKDAIPFTVSELEYMKNGASCDFVIYFIVGKKPLAVIEVDGGYHDTPEQQERDSKKNTILRKAAIPLLRIRTTESGIKNIIKNFIHDALQYTASSQDS